MENDGQANLFHHFRDSKDVLRNSGEMVFTMVLFCMFHKSLTLLDIYHGSGFFLEKSKEAL